jgi:subtilase family serine protease
MGSHCFYRLIILLLAALISCIVGCTAEPPRQPVPTINSFNAMPAEINPGQWTTIEWSTSGAKKITISPEINNVGSSGSLSLSPNETTTYVLTATNEAGSTTASAVVKVMPVDIGKPDLLITDIFCEGCILHYKIKNQGNAIAMPSRSQLIVAVPTSKVIDWVDYLDAGEEVNTTFPSLVMGGDQHCWCAGTFKICADIDNEVEESNEDNNCLTQVAH